MPHGSRHAERQLERYLLGLLPDEDAERLDEMSIVDDEVASRLRVAEDNLVDAYVRGAMSGDMLTRFESVYLSSPRRRQKVRFAVNLLGLFERAGVPVDTDNGRASLEGARREIDRRIAASLTIGRAGMPRARARRPPCR